MELVDRLLVQGKAAARRLWAGALPHVMLDVWWVRGDHARTYALLDAIPDSAMSRAMYAALDRDAERARDQALLALADADLHSIETVALAVPRHDPVVREHAIQTTRRVALRDSLVTRLIDPDLDPPPIDTLAEDPRHGRLLVAWAASRVPADERRATLERAWAATGDDSIGVFLATRAVNAWDTVPTAARPSAARILALDGALASVARFAAEVPEAYLRREIQIAATLAEGHIPAEWVEAIQQFVAGAQAQYEEGLITESERLAGEWALAICHGRDAVDARAAEGFVAAHVATSQWLQSLGAPRPPADWRARVTRTVANAVKSPSRLYRLIRVLASAGAEGDRESVRLGIDEVERALGPIDPERFHGASALAYYPGRARTIAAGLGDYVNVDTHAHVALGLAADGHVDEALVHAAAALDGRAATLDRELLDALAPLVFYMRPGARDRLLAFVADDLSRVPGIAWLQDPIAPAIEPSTHSARSPELEARLANGDAASVPVYADWLMAHGDPRGELMALEHAGKQAEADVWRARHRTHVLGPLAQCDATFTWRAGFIDTARLVHHHLSPSTAPRVASALAMLLDHPSGALLRDLVIALDIGDEGTCNFQPALAVLQARAPATLRRLRVGEFRHAGPGNVETDLRHEMSWTSFGDLRELWPHLARLEALTLQGRLEEPTLGSIDLAALRELAILTGGLAGENTRAIASVTRPNLEVLELWFGNERYGFSGSVDDVIPLLDRRKLPRLHTLRLMNAPFTDALVEPLVRSKLLPQLREVSFALGTLTDDGAAAIARHRRAFEHLAVLDLQDNCLTDASFEVVDKIAKTLHFLDQKDPAEERYASVGE